MARAADVLNVARSLLGIVERPNGSNMTPIGAWYGWNGVAWCAMTVSYCMAHVGRGDIRFAYCPYGINDFKNGKFGSWLSRNATVQPGDVVFYDWEGDGVSDHVGFVESVRGDGTLVTIEGNTENACKRLVRGRGNVVGFGRPRYDAEVVNPPVGNESSLPVLRIGSRGPAVLWIQTILKNHAGNPNLALDSSFGPATQKAVINLQKFFHLTADGIVGPATWGVINFINK